MPEISGIIQNYLRGSIESLGGEPPVIESKTITENGTYTAPSGVDGYNPIVVNVPAPEPVIEPKSIFVNGEYTAPEGVDGYSPIIVDVPLPEPVIESKTITENGTYTAPSGVDGYSPVEVAVPIPEPVIESKTITENGTYTAPEGVDGYSPVEVNVPLPENAYLLKSVTTPTPIASFTDGEEMVMPSLKVAIEPQQEGSGDPSPTNIRPISGWSSVNVGVAGKNLFDENSVTENKGLNQTGGLFNSDTYAVSDFIMIPPNTTFYLSNVVGSSNGIASCFYDSNKEFISTGPIYGGGGQFVSGTVTSPSNATYMRVETNTNNYEGVTVVSIGSTATTYEPYAGNTYTIDLDGTRYGGELDVVNGIVTPAPYYASYNGETLTGEWISDRDKYEVGATPTIGAQVVNIGASGTPVSILPTTVKSLRGVNNLFADSGQVQELSYFSKEV